jgi:tetrahydromethanopterin S-methyltransferase subunit A
MILPQKMTLSLRRDVMSPAEALQIIRTELEAGITLTKCQQCGCMADTLTQLTTVLPTIDTKDATILAQRLTEALQHMRPIQYPCLGCAHCYPAVASNTLSRAFPAIDLLQDASCTFSVRENEWAPVVGEYVIVDKSAPVAVSTLASVAFADALVQDKPHGLAIVGKTETENIRIDKLIKNVITNPAIQYLIVAGVDAQGHYPGATLLALAAHGIDEKGRVIGSPGKRPVLRNVSATEIQAFRHQVQVIDMMGCDQPEAVRTRIAALAQHVRSSCGCHNRSTQPLVSVTTVPRLVAPDPGDVVRLDKAGYFVIVPLADRRVITVEHYAYDHTLLRVIEGTTARALYRMLIANGWVSELSHAAYLGKELTRAEFALTQGDKYVQDGA